MRRRLDEKTSLSQSLNEGVDVDANNINRKNSHTASLGEAGTNTRNLLNRGELKDLIDKDPHLTELKNQILDNVIDVVIGEIKTRKSLSRIKSQAAEMLNGDSGGRD